MARTNLAGIRELSGHLEAQALNGRPAYHAHADSIPGGDVLVMLAPVEPTRPPGTIRHVTTELPGDPRPPLDVLAYWANLWSAHTGQAARRWADVDAAADHLDRRLHRIADHPLFVSLARDLARLRHSLEEALHAGYRPDVSRVPCWECGTRLVKVWTDTEVHDHWRCPGCGENYDRGRYDRAAHDHLASQGAERYVPLTDAVAVTGRPEQTIRDWVREGLVASRRLPGGPREVWWPDVRTRHLVTPHRKRRRST